MLAGQLYDPLDPELVAARTRARDLCQSLNATREAEQEAKRRILRELFGAVILAGVRIGSRAVIGAGSVVTRDIREGMFAAGNPCRVIRQATENVVRP
jgi:hypothetical protein